MEREEWSSTLGFILASIGSAVGIGNIWRFPYVVGANGGGAFLIPFLIAVLLFGLPLMVLELAIGRSTGTSVISAFRSIRQRFAAAGLVIVAVVSLILGYYLVITSWVLAYALFFVFNQPMEFDAFTGSYLPLVFFLLSGLAVYVTVRSGVRGGIERASRYLIPFLLVILIFLVVISLTEPGAVEGIEFYLSPDFSRLADPGVWIAAFGQAFFSLSVGMGILLTFGSYLKREPLFRNAAIIAAADMLIAVLTGLVIFPLVFTAGLDPAAGVNLAFITLPTAFTEIQYGMVLGALFFLMLFAAALTSAVSMLEVPVAALMDTYGYPRKRATLLVFAAIMLVGLPSALSYTALNLEALGMPFLDLADYAFGTIGLIVAGLIVSVVGGWFMSRIRICEEIGGCGWQQKIYMALIRYGVPSILLITLVGSFFLGTG
ncbi:sodium-dependent transporter [Methanoculleus sp. FWC-SCC3]|uniref:Transporter n=1 Tax=Methanoculleus methanifontis TaxID=2584086 RepID=A0ABT8M517_9EURY|nr:sodium-dependent transporter [Methanoculleus sp. FWC-SCC3]MDN7013684.1 sodium-dependent transporter [Methanoculleus sp. FWC-SCC3]